MALGAKSLFNYGIQVSTLNNALDFKIAALGPTLTAFLSPGFYSPQGLAAQIAFQLQSLDSVNIYSVTVTRNIGGGTQNRMIVSTNGSYLSLLFSSGPNVNISCSGLMGFNISDYTGFTTYTGSASIGTILIPSYIAYNYNDSTKLFGAVNVAASGLKESTTFALQKFLMMEFRYENALKKLEWENFLTWAIQQRAFEFIPEISDPNTFFDVTLESTETDGQGLGYSMTNMLPDYPYLYQTGSLQFRLIP